MNYTSLQACILDLEKNGHLVRVKEEVDPCLVMAAVHLRVNEAGGPALLFERVKGSPFPAVSNLFGTKERTHFIFRNTLPHIKQLINLKENPFHALKNPFAYSRAAMTAYYALPKKSYRADVLYGQTTVSQLPQIKCWTKDGGAFITLPQVYTEDCDQPGWRHSNLGMYRIQISGNNYVTDKEIGLHYQIHRGIGVHQAKSNAKGQPLRVSIFVGGPPAHSFAAVMPLPEGMPEVAFAGAMTGRRFRYYYHNGYFISCDADFVITGIVYPGENKPEGPFGDHLGYYSLEHKYPVMRVDNVYHRKNAIWPFTVVGRPPQEDTMFGELVHEITGPVIPKTIPGLHEINAVDAAGVHPLLLAIGSERYTPYMKEKRPQELLTIANHLLGFGQLSLAKYLFITDKADNPKLSVHSIADYFAHVLERVDWTRDLHFYTNTTIDTLDYSGTGINTGSKVVIAAVGEKKRDLGKNPPSQVNLPDGYSDIRIALPGVLAISATTYKSHDTSAIQIKLLLEDIGFQNDSFNNFPLIVLVDDTRFVAKTLNNFLWATFTRSNPSHDIYGVDGFIKHKHWGCRGPLVIDARIKPHHAPVLEKDTEVEKIVDALGAKGKSLHGII